MNDSVLVNQVYLIFNRPQFLVDSSDNNSKKRGVLLKTSLFFNVKTLYVKEIIYLC